MYKVRYYTSDGSEGESRDLPLWLFDGIVNKHVLHEAVTAYQANQRQGTGSAKTRSEVRGGGRKPWRQKGTGRARHGTIRSPIWEGGGITFPPKPKSWRKHLSKKKKRLARRSALNARASDDRLILVDLPDFDEPKTRKLVTYLESVGAEGKILLLTRDVKPLVYLSGRNLQEVEIQPFGQETAYEVLRANLVVVEREALEAATEEAEESGLAARRRERIRERMEAGREIAEAEEAAEAEKAAEAEPSEAEAAVEAPEPEEVAELPEDEAAPEPEEHEEEAPADVGARAEEIDLPTVAELADFLATLDDPELIRALQERDGRKTAQRHYDARLEDLEGGEEDDDGRG